MSVYVDGMRARFGRMIMCHMLADTEAELHEMADKIGVARRWYQGNHYDVCLSKRALALRHGAKEIGRHDLATLLRAKRATAMTPASVAGRGRER